MPATFQYSIAGIDIYTPDDTSNYLSIGHDTDDSVAWEMSEDFTVKIHGSKHDGRMWPNSVSGRFINNISSLSGWYSYTHKSKLSRVIQTLKKQFPTLQEIYLFDGYNSFLY